jgi:hypothetical protein
MTVREKQKGGSRRLTISSCWSPSFLPMSLLIQSSWEFPSLDCRPGTTRGMLKEVGGVVYRLCRSRCFVVRSLDRGAIAKVIVSGLFGSWASSGVEGIQYLCTKTLVGTCVN